MLTTTTTITRWRNKPGTYTLTVYGDWAGSCWCWFNAADDRPLCLELAVVVWQAVNRLELDTFGQPITDLELRVHFLSTGYYDPGSRCGAYDAWREPEGEDTREVDFVEVVASDGRRVRLNSSLAAEVWGCCADAAAEVVVPVEHDGTL